MSAARIYRIAESLFSILFLGALFLAGLGVAVTGFTGYVAQVGRAVDRDVRNAVQDSIDDQYRAALLSNLREQTQAETSTAPADSH